MACRILICDDSPLARHQMARALPAGLSGSASFAANGHEALSLLSNGQRWLLFLDLNMPQMDGYQVLARIREQSLPVLSIVVSADLQPRAMRRVAALGALAFIAKPFRPEQILHILQSHNLWQGAAVAQTSQQTYAPKISYLESCQELANVAMGQATDRLSRWLNVFINQPIPTVRECTSSGLRRRLSDGVHENSRLVRQGFVGSRIAGEALFICDKSQLPTLARLASQPTTLNDVRHEELLMDLASIITGTFLSSLSDQLDISFSQRHPTVLREAPAVRLAEGATPALCIDIPYTVSQPALSFELMLLLTPGSLPELQQRLQVFAA